LHVADGRDGAAEAPRPQAEEIAEEGSEGLRVALPVLLRCFGAHACPYSTKMSTTIAASPARAAAPTTRPARSSRHHAPSTRAAATKASTPLPASCQLSAMTGASVSKPAACVAFRVRFHAMNPAVVHSPQTTKRPARRDQAGTAVTAAAATPATTP